MIKNFSRKESEQSIKDNANSADSGVLMELGHRVYDALDIAYYIVDKSIKTKRYINNYTLNFILYLIAEEYYRTTGWSIFYDVIGVGKGNPDWNFSGPHGAGRILSRTQAKQLITLEDFKESMKGITGTVCQETIDEAPMVYKKADEIERLISETVEVTNHLKVLANFKGF